MHAPDTAQPTPPPVDRPALVRLIRQGQQPTGTFPQRPDAERIADLLIADGWRRG